jgi:hypothetical protein
MAPVMPRRKPTPEELERGAFQAMDTVTTLLQRLREAQGHLVEAALLIGLDWPEIAEATGKSSAKAAEEAHKRWKSGQ